MGSATENLNSDIIYDLYGGGFWGQITRIALELDLFSALSEGPTSAEQAAEKCQASEIGIRTVLNYLSSTDLLNYQSDSDKYSLTPSASAFLVRGSKTYAGDWVLALTDPDLWERMYVTIQSGESAGYTLPWDQDAWIESFSPTRVEYSLNIWETVGVDSNLNTSYKILDLASGCGIKTMALAQRNKSVVVTCLDHPSVLEVAKELAGRLEVEEQISFIPSDLLTVDLGVEVYNAGLLGLITYILTPDQNQDLFQRIYKALLPGGKLVIDAIMAAEEPKEWSSRVSLLMYTWNGGSAHSFADYETWLKQAGFEEVVYHNEQLVSATK